MAEKKRIDYKHNFREYFSIVKNYKWVIGVLLVVGLLQESKAFLDRYLLKIIIDNGTEFSSGSLLLSAFMKILLVIMFVYISATLVNVVLNWVRINFLNILDAKTIFDLKQRYFTHILKLDHSFHTTHKTGSLISRLARGASAMERMNDAAIFEFAPLILQATLAIIALAYLDRTSALIMMAIIAVFLSFNYYRQRISEPANVSLNKTEDIEKGRMADFFTNIDSVRYFGKENFIIKIYRKLSANTSSGQMRNWGYYSTTNALQGFVLAAGTFALVFFSIRNFMAGHITLGTLSFIYVTYLGLTGPLFGFVGGMRSFSRSMADFQELFDYGKIESKIQDSQDSKTLELEHGSAEFRNVYFSYGKRRIFRDFNLKIKRNEKVALVGHSGSGKTTLIKLLYRLYDVDSGHILLDGKDIKGFKQESLRSEMSVVPQECVLFDDTIFNNIQFSNPNASRKEVMRAIKFAQLDKIIESFPKKENTIVGERGVKLSGGEKQRVSIARALLANKKILVLDEATSSLDSETEHEIQQDLAELMEGRTSIMIAHRLSTIMRADRIIVLKAGKIVQEGTHAQLISKPGEYRKLWNLQKGGYLTS